jgi:hypothetical protein
MSRRTWPDHPGRTAGQFGPVADRSVPYTGPSGYVTDRPTYFVGPSDSTRVHVQTTQVAPYMTRSSEYNPGPFSPIVDRPVPYDGRSGYETTQVVPYMVRQSRYTLGPFGPVTDRPTSYVGPSGYVYVEPIVAQYTQFPHPSQQHYSAPPATYYNHALPPHGHMAEYSSATREPKRYRVGGGGINRTPNTHLRHPWEESQQNDVRQPEISTHKLNGGPPDVVEKSGTR